ncbi:hypothetical protein BGX38DRAFT_1206588 [Terfezia claveryi]|nr:hypothetical protein BGX38DRAFT_1206588 [Terfezia claveryi]
MPGDYDSSPWAGANWLPVSAPNTPAAEWDRATFKEFWRLAKNAPESGIHVQDMIIYSRNADAGKVTADWLSETLIRDPWFKEIVPEFRPLSSSELPPDVDSGIKFKSVCINTALYLPYLTSQCPSPIGSFSKRAVLTHILDALSFHRLAPRADLIVNCTGLLASKLGGVKDSKVYPTRGQIVIVRNTAPEMYSISGVDSPYGDECMYIMTRAAGGGTVLGGSYEKGSSKSQSGPDQAVGVMKRAIRYCPELVKPGFGIEDLDVVRHRPRLELEKKVWDGWEGLGEVRVVHNYGVGGLGNRRVMACRRMWRG